MANYVSAEDMRRIAQHIRSKMTSPDAGLVERVEKIEEKISPAASATNQLADKNFVLQHASSGGAGGALEVYDDDGNLVFGATPDGARALVETVETVTENSDEITAEFAENIYYPPITFKCGEDTFIGNFNYDEDADYEGFEAYKFTFYKLAGELFEEWWTVAGAQAYILFMVAYGLNITYADGKLVLFGPADLEGSEAIGTWTVDVLDRSMSFDPLDVEKLTSVMNGDIKGSLATRGCLFLNVVPEDGENDSKHMNIVIFWKGGFSVLFDEPVFMSSPSSGDNAYFLGAAVHGGFAYVAFSIFYFTFVFRTSLETGERQYCVFTGIVQPDKSLGDDFPVNSLMVDDENIAMFGTCQFFKSESDVAEPFVGAARIPQDSARWVPWSGDLKGLPDVFSPFRTYRMPAEEGIAQIPCKAFLYDADLAVLKMTAGTEEQVIRAVRLSFADDAEHEETLYGGVVAGSLKESSLVEWELDPSDVAEFYRKMYEIYSFMVYYGAAFPARLDDRDAVRMSYVLLDESMESQRWRLKTKFLERKSDITGNEAMPVGTGFTRVTRDIASGKSKYYLDTGAYIEFNKDGTATGAQVAQDAAGRVEKIEEKIPEEASKDNQLADKSFVTRHVATNTANFRGEWPDWVSVPSDSWQYPKDYTGSTTPTENDYMVVQDTKGYREEIIPAEWVTKDWGSNKPSGSSIWHDNDGNIYYSYSSTQLQLVDGKWVAKSWGTNKPSGNSVWRDNDGNIYCSDGSTQLQLVDGEWVTKDWGSNKPTNGERVWHDNDGNVYCSDGSIQLQFIDGKWVTKDWSPPYGSYIWHDNDGNVYCSYSSTQLQLVGGEWVTKDWGTNKPNYGKYIWRDNDGNIYYSDGSTQLQLIDGEWVTKDWGSNRPSGSSIWHDNDGNIYCSDDSTQLQLVDGKWVAKGWEISYGSGIWHDNDGNVYRSDGSTQLQFIGGKWVTKDWGSNRPPYGGFIWHDNDGNIYHSGSTQLQLIDGEWVTKDWGSSNPNGSCIWHDNDGNIYCSDEYDSTQLQLVGGKWVIKNWGSNKPSYGSHVWHDNDGNIYYSYSSTQLQLVDGKWVAKSWGTNKPSGNSVWRDNDGNIYCSDGSTQLQFIDGKWVTKDWGSNKPSYGNYIWHDNDGNIYYSYSSTQLQLVDGKWVAKSWNPPYGSYIWHDNDGNVYYSYSSTQLQLVDGEWVTKDWGTNKPSNGSYIWHDNDGNIYYSYSSTQLQFIGGEWVTKDWGDNKPDDGKYIWHNDGNIYYSYSSTQLQLVDGKWVAKSWNPPYGGYVWRDNDGNIYYSYSSTQLQLVDGEWVTKDWGTNKPSNGSYIWHDNDGNIYYSYSSTQLQFIDGKWVTKDWGDNKPDDGKYIWHNDGNIYYSYSSTQLQFMSEQHIIDCEGAWQFKYTGQWSEQGKDGWEPQFVLDAPSPKVFNLDVPNSGKTYKLKLTFKKYGLPVFICFAIRGCQNCPPNPVVIFDNNGELNTVPYEAKNIFTRRTANVFTMSIPEGNGTRHFTISEMHPGTLAKAEIV